MVVAAGVETQEYTYLSLEQRKALIRRTIEFVDGRVPVMVGISHAVVQDRGRARALAPRAAARPRCSCWRRCVRSPGRRRRPISSPISRRSARETDLPITLYLNPGPGADVSIPDTIALAKLPQRAAHQGELARSGAGVAAHRRDRSRRSRPLFHHHADAAGDAAAGRLRRDHAAAGIGDRARTSSTPSWPRTTSARSNCSFSSRCSRRSGCIAASPPP